MSTLIVGCGFLGRRVGVRLVRLGEPTFGTTRAAERASVLAEAGIKPVILDVSDPTSLGDLPRTRRVLYCVGFDRRSGLSLREVYVDGLGRVLDALDDRVERFVHVSSTGVYGQDDGDWVDESSPAEPATESGRVLLDAEGLAFDRFGDRAVVLRMAGLYGPGRIVRRASIERGGPIAGDPDRFLNLIHVEDAAAACVAALEHPRPSALYLVADDKPVARRAYYERVAGVLGAPAPRFIPPTPDSPEAARDRSNKQVSNVRAKEELGWSPRYRDSVAGLAAALAGNGPAVA